MVYFHVVFPELLPGRKEFGDLRREDMAKRVKPFIKTIKRRCITGAAR